MDFTSRMVALLGELRRERNGAVADSMRYYGARYGLNYGVSLPTVRQIASTISPDHDFAHYLYLQDVRELRLAALHIACPDRLTADEFGTWAAGIVNSEVAEEAAFALLCRSGALPELFAHWLASGEPLLQYAALMAAGRSPLCDRAWVQPTVDVVHRAAAVATEEPSAPTADPTGSSSYAVHLLAQGAVALLAAVGEHDAQSRQTVFHAVGSLGEHPAENFIREELAWRLDAHA